MKWEIMLVVVGLVAIQTEAHENTRSWKFFFTNVESDFFYDPDTVSKSPESIVRVCWKEVFKTKEVLRSRGFTGSECEKVVYQLNVTEINCLRKEWRRKCFMLRSGERDDTGCTIHKERSDKWVPVMEGRPIGALYGKVCG